MARPPAFPLAFLLAAALFAAPLAAAAQTPDAEAVYDQLRQNGPAASYWHALDQAFPDEGPRLLARALAQSPDLDRAVVATLVEADRLPWEEPQLMMQAPVEKLMAQQRAMAGVYVAALNDNVGPCADTPDRRELSSPDVEHAWRRYRLAVMQAAAAGRLDPVRRARAGASDQAFYEAAYRELRAQA
ncbi:hypothetical protein, partial [Caulobacter sp. 17J65-9]|uniref:hypothetical protein n=1 Tax=Caulobacter sp. 17J65-9 TaxID=2709382 RepID=UPI0013C638ED